MNRALPCLLLVALLAAPAAAEPDATARSDTYVQDDDSVLVIQVAEWRDVEAAAYEPVAHAYVPTSVSAVRVFLGGAGGGPRQEVPAANVTRLGDLGDYATYRVDLAGLQPNVTDGATYRVTFEYTTLGQSLQAQARYNLTEYSVIARPLDGYRPESGDLGTFTQTGPGAFHAAATNVDAGTEFRTAFAPVPAGADDGDGNALVYGIAGLILGALVVWAAFRVGWLKAPGRATKFVKGGTMESTGMLQARRRTLLAALKELEQAREANEVKDDVYGPLKEEYKAMAVRVMRSLEEKKE